MDSIFSILMLIGSLIWLAVYLFSGESADLAVALLLLLVAKP